MKSAENFSNGECHCWNWSFLKIYANFGEISLVGGCGGDTTMEKYLPRGREARSGRKLPGTGSADGVGLLKKKMLHQRKEKKNAPSQGRAASSGGAGMGPLYGGLLTPIHWLDPWGIYKSCIRWRLKRTRCESSGGPRVARSCLQSLRVLLVAASGGAH